MAHGFRNHRRVTVSSVRRCATCSRALKDEDGYECGPCRENWKMAQRSPAFLPTVELELYGIAGPPTPPPPPLDLFTEE